MTYLKVNIIEAGYGKKVILKDFSLSVEKEKIIAFIGPNGAGKSTLLKSIIGTSDFANGEILFEGKNILHLSVEERIKMGIGFVPQGSRVFTDLTVIENLETGGFLINDKLKLNEKIEEVLQLFPQLKSLLRKDAGDLSGGEKQQLALARSLILNPRLLLLDEPSLGLSPALVNSSFEMIVKIKDTFNCTILIVEQKIISILKIVDEVYALKNGDIVFNGLPYEIKDNLKNIFLS